MPSCPTFLRRSRSDAARWQQRTRLRAPTVQGLGAGLLVQDAAAVRTAVYAELNIVQCVAVRGGAVATAAVCARALGNACAAMRAAARTALNFLARIALRGGALTMGAVCVGALIQAAAAMRAAAHTALNIVARVKVPVSYLARGPAGPRTGTCGHR